MQGVQHRLTIFRINQILRNLTARTGTGRVNALLTSLLDDFQEELFKITDRIAQFDVAGILHAMRQQPLAQLFLRIRAQCRADHAGLVLFAENLAQSAVCTHSAAVQHEHVVADILNVRQQVAAENDGLAAASQQADDIFHFTATNRIQTARRFVQNHQIRIVHKSLRQTNTTRHAFRKFTDAAVESMRQTNHVQQLFATLTTHLRAEAKQRTVEIQRFHGRQITVKIRLFRQIADTAFDFNVLRVFAKNLQDAARGIQQPKNHFHGR